jgi:two-component system, sensor histidine kinase PdtaS
MKHIQTLLLNVFLLFGLESSAQNLGNSNLEQAIKLAKSYQKKANWYRETPQFNRDSTVYYFNKAVKLLETQKNIPHFELAEIYCDIIDRSNRSHPFITVDSFAVKGLAHFNKIPKKKQDKLLKYKLLQRSASIKVEKGEHKEAVALFSEALELIQDDTNPNIRANFLSDKSNFIIRYGLPEEEQLSYKLLDESYAIYKTLDQQKYTKEISGIYSAMIGRYFFTNADSTKHYFKLSQELGKASKNPFYHAWYNSYLADFHYTNKEYKKAKGILADVIVMLEKYNMTNVDTYALSFYILADIAVEEKEFDVAIPYYQKVIELSKANNFKSFSIEVLEAMSKAYEGKGDLKNALDFARQYNEKNLANVQEKNKRSLRENELQINVLNQEKELIKNRETQTVFFICFIVGAALLSFLFWNFKQKQKHNLKLETLNLNLKDKNNLLDKKVAENELLLKEIHHRVKNNLEIVSSLLELQSSQLDDPTVQAAMLSSQNRVHSMGIIHQKLYQSEHLTSIEMRDYFINLGENIRQSFNADGKVKIDCNMPELVLDVDTAISIGLISNELLTNAFKYAFEGKPSGQINISLKKHDSDKDRLELRISDDGIGKIINSPSKGTGFGTMLIDLLTKQLNGKLSYSVDKGTLVSLIFTKPK